jgi:hypothetical protein
MGCVAGVEPNGEEAGAAMAVRFGSAEKKKGKGKRGGPAGCTKRREEVEAWLGTACGTAEGGPGRQQPARAAGAGSGRAAWEAGEWGEGGWQVGQLGVGLSHRERRRRERGGEANGWDRLGVDLLARRGGRER